MGREPAKGLAGRQGRRVWGPKLASLGQPLRQSAFVPLEEWLGLLGTAGLEPSLQLHARPSCLQAGISTPKAI